MTLKEAVKAMLKETNRTQEYIGSHLNPVQTRNGVTMMLARGNTTVSRLWEICDILGYEVVLRPKKKGAANRDNTFILECETKAERTARIAEKANGGK